LKTDVTIQGDAFHINGKPTYENRYYQGQKIEGLLLISRMINGIFDDDNPYTRELWKYPDTETWDPMRNTKELVTQMPVYRSYGLNTITIGLQGGSALAYSAPRKLVMDLLKQQGVYASEDKVYQGCIDDDRAQPWNNTAVYADGSLNPAFMERLRLVIEQADALGMIVIAVLFYFGQDERLTDERAVKTAVHNACHWVLEQGFTNVLIEINNECNVPRYEHEILQPHRVHELIAYAKHVTHNGKRLLVGTSYSSGRDQHARRYMPSERVVSTSDMIFLHGNGLTPQGIRDWVNQTRQQSTYTPKPILFDEDDHYEFEQPLNNFTTAISVYSGWGYFDNGGETSADTHHKPAIGNYRDGYQNIPVNWRLSSPRKQAFFRLVKEISGS
jgi:hypothetical protein